MQRSATIAYFGLPVCQEAIANYFYVNGITPFVRDKLINDVVANDDSLFDIVANYIEGKAKYANSNSA